MTVLVAVGKILLSAAAELLVDLTKRATSAAKDRLRRKDPVDATPPISADKYTGGMLDGIDRERSRALGDEMTERARKQLERIDDHD